MLKRLTNMMMRGTGLISHKVEMPTWGKRENYDDLKIMDNVKSIVKGKPQK